MSAASSAYIAIDLKSFYASVECVERGLNPLTAHLVVADSSRTNKTICLAVTPSLKAYGLSGRCRLFEVEEKAAEVLRRTGRPLSYVIAPPRMALYMEYSAKIYAIYLQYVSADDIYSYSIDEVFIDAAPYLHLYPQPDPEHPGQTRPATASELATLIMQDIYQATGITATAGIGTNLFLAKVALDIVAKHAKPNDAGVRIGKLDELSYRYLLWDHRPLTDFWRIGPGTAKKLASYQIDTMGQLASFSLRANVDGTQSGEDFLYKLFGVDAEILIDHAWGYEPCTMQAIKAYRPASSSLCEGQVLPAPYSFEQGKLIVREMLDRLAMQLTEKQLLAGSITLHVGYDRENLRSGTFSSASLHIDHYGRPVPKPAHGSVSLSTPTFLLSKLAPPVLNLYNSIVDSRLWIRRVTLTAGRLVSASAPRQLTLFSSLEPSDKETHLQQAVLHIQKRFGKNALLKGSNLLAGSTMQARNLQIGGHSA